MQECLNQEKGGAVLNTCKQAGFTLIELSIVLVIIGLIVGGVLVGQDLIKAAELRATVSQLEKYSTAANTFRGKYNALPGDLRDFANFGFIATGRTAGTDGRGDGDSQIEGKLGSGATGYDFSGEAKMFWRDLQDATLIGENVSTNDASGAALTSLVGYMPQAKMGRSNFIHVGNTGGLNYFIIGQATAVTAATFIPTGGQSITPLEAFQMDSKIDDGMPATGTAISVRNFQPGTAAGGAGAPAAGDCYNSTAGAIAYNTATPAIANAPGCQMSFRTSF